MSAPYAAAAERGHFLIAQFPMSWSKMVTSETTPQEMRKPWIQLSDTSSLDWWKLGEASSVNILIWAKKAVARSINFTWGKAQLLNGLNKHRQVNQFRMRPKLQPHPMGWRGNNGIPHFLLAFSFSSSTRVSISNYQIVQHLPATPK